MTGVTLKLATTWSELQAVKDGTSTMMIAYTQDKAPATATFNINVPLDVCEVVGKEVRVNVSRIKETASELGELMGKTFGAELDE
ncbi:hypothetical protein [Brevibacillus porteri]|uniref:Uncharacterized protein n=1 Tax=Brevibacillus porteri TaxID=2126350 RepID=A0ABX5FHV0_9BACL|nr:hypothetical protein [Brevibacillus porteri]MED1801703.1 hypothetical protein [Brevibacillus porteri]MED2135277.1 hypothetical protein [Brevibacillus porteri]MED2748009.1 hypothetical protein [Brevibacillus porteri]MED2813751.1 hypothetical protein [Brevibacillus porteri]MED2894747.1 hypothetical protein [Brevibacillus porteri]